MKLNETTPLNETRSFIIECLNDYKTNASKKAFLTRELKQLSQFIDDVKRTVGNSYGWLHGELFTTGHLEHYEKELQLVNELRNAI